jgi:hypothetical protein
VNIVRNRLAVDSEHKKQTLTEYGQTQGVGWTEDDVKSVLLAVSNPTALIESTSGSPQVKTKLVDATAIVEIAKTIAKDLINGDGGGVCRSVTTMVADAKTRKTTMTIVPFATIVICIISASSYQGSESKDGSHHASLI